MTRGRGRGKKHQLRRIQPGPTVGSGGVENLAHNDCYVKYGSNTDLNSTANPSHLCRVAEAPGHALSPAYQISTGTHSNPEVAHVAETPSDHSTPESKSKATQQKPKAQVPGLPLAIGATQVAKAKALSATAETGSGICILLLCLVLSIFTGPGQASPASTRLDPRTAGMLDFIGSLEAPGGYDVYSHYAAAPPPKPLTKMTVNEVLAWQDRIDAQSRSEAAGRFQIMEDTLRDYLVPTMGLTGREKFSADMQNAMAVVLMQRRGWSPKGTNHIRMGNALAREWAALPLLSGPDTGKSAHHKTKGVRNRALTTPEQFLAVLQDPTQAKAVLTAVKHSPAKPPVKVTRLGLGAVRIRTFQRTRPTAPDDLTGGALKPSRVIVFDVDPYAQK